MEEGIEQGKAEGVEQGLEKGIEQGLEKGIEQGLEQGKAEGIEQEKIQIAKNLLNSNVDLQTICLSTGLNKEQIEELRNI